MIISLSVYANDIYINQSGATLDLDVLQDFIDANPSLTGQNTLDIGSQEEKNEQKDEKTCISNKSKK